MQEVLDRSAQLCKQSYQKPVMTILSGHDVLLKKGLALNHAQKQVFLILFYWRDQQARLYHIVCVSSYRLDESGQFILPIASLIKLAQMLPKSTADLPRLLHPVPPEVRRNSHVLIELIKKGCEAPDMNASTLLAVYNEVCGVSIQEEVEPKELPVEPTEPVEPMAPFVVKEELEHPTTNVLKEMLMEGSQKLLIQLPNTCGDYKTEGYQSPLLFQQPDQKRLAHSLADQDRLEHEQERMKKKEAIDEELNVDELFRDLAMISGMMDHDESEEEIEEEEIHSLKEVKEEEIHSLKEVYKKPVEEVIPLKRDRSDDVDELLGTREIELKSEVGLICMNY